MNKISPKRKAAYYAGMCISTIGLITFLSAILVFWSNFGVTSGFESTAKTIGLLAFAGVVLMVLGSSIGKIGAMGLSGSGLKLDPDQAREDLKPYSKMAGGMIGDALSEVNRVVETKVVEKIMVRCQKCKTPNDELAKFCNHCGASI